MLFCTKKTCTVTKKSDKKRVIFLVVMLLVVIGSSRDTCDQDASKKNDVRCEFSLRKKKQINEI